MDTHHTPHTVHVHTSHTPHINTHTIHHTHIHYTHTHTHHTPHMHTNITHIHTTHTSYIHITPHTHTHTQSPWSAILRHSGTLGTLQSPIHRRKDLSCGLSASQTRTGCWSASTLQTSQETQPAGLILSASRAEGRRAQRGADSAKAG